MRSISFVKLPAFARFTPEKTSPFLTYGRALPSDIKSGTIFNMNDVKTTAKIIGGCLPHMNERDQDEAFYKLDWLLRLHREARRIHYNPEYDMIVETDIPHHLIDVRDISHTRFKKLYFLESHIQKKFSDY